MDQRLTFLIAVSLIVMACSRAPVPGASSAVADVPRCEDVPQIAAPAEAYRGTPIYVANEMPTEQIQEWARGKPGFQTIWIDREHHGWVTVAFSEDAAARQAELESAFPGVGVVAVEVDWTMADLEALQQRVSDELIPDIAYGSALSVTKGTVEAWIGALTEDRIRAVESKFAGQRLCVSGVDPGEVVPQGQQPESGDGWRLLANERDAGEPYRTGIATDQDAYVALWRSIGLAGDPPTVDLESDVVIWFGAVYGSSCPGLRLDDVVVARDRELPLIHAVIVLPGTPGACTADANPHAFLVAVERSKLPAPPFGIQLGSDDPPGGAPEERTIVDADLRQPGSTAAPGQVHADPNLPEPWVVEPDGIIEPDFEVPFRLNVHCGVEWLGRLNNVAWRTDVPKGEANYIPAEWMPLVADESIVVSVLLTAGPDPTVTATAGGYALVYRPSTEDPPGCD